MHLPEGQLERRYAPPRCDRVHTRHRRCPSVPRAACLLATVAMSVAILCPPAAASPSDPQLALVQQATALFFPGSGSGAQVAEKSSATATLNHLKYLGEQGGQLSGAQLGIIGDFLARPSGLDRELESAHFVIHYTENAPDAPLGWPESDAFLKAAGDICEAAYKAYHVDQPWPVPPSLDTGGSAVGKVHVYMRDLGSGVFGYALHEDLDGARGHAGYIVVDNDFAGFATNQPIEALEVTLAHEYHHVVQFGFGYDPAATWFMEQTATFEETTVSWRPAQLRPYLEAFGSHAYQRLDLCNGYFEYGAWLWPRFIVERWGWEPLVEIWETWSGGAVPMLSAAAIVLEEAESAMAEPLATSRSDAGVLDAAVLEWATRNALLGEARPVAGHQYERGGELPAIVLPELTVEQYPVTGLRPEPIRQPEPLGASYILLRPQAGSADNVLTLEVNASAGLAGAQLIVLDGAEGTGYVITGSIHSGTCAFEVKDWQRAARAVLVLTTGFGSPNACDYRLAASTRYVPKSSAGVDPPGSELARTWLRALPNPFEPYTVLQYELPSAGDVRLRIVDAQGRLVALLWDGPASPGRHGIYWDGRGAGGARAAAGVYYALLESAPGTRQIRIVRVR